MASRSDLEHRERALAIWRDLSDNERRLLNIGVFPAEAITAVERDGFRASTMAVELMAFQRAHDRPRFRLGRIVATPGALNLLIRGGTSAHSYLARHVHGDWGDVGDEDKRANDTSVVNGSRVLSSYEVQGEKLWVITEADRTSTCLLLPSEY